MIEISVAEARAEAILATPSGDGPWPGVLLLMDANGLRPRIQEMADRIAGWRLAEKHRPIHNLVISNVPGPQVPIYLAGAKLVAVYPMGPVMEGAGLNVTVMSYDGHVDFGFMVAADLVPDVWSLSAGVQPAYEELRNAK